jgi:hypothetical protein
MGLTCVGEDPVGHGSRVRADDGCEQRRNVVFTSPTTAWVAFDVYLRDQPDLTNLTGTAVLTDGTWKVTRQTACTLLHYAAVSCPS